MNRILFHPTDLPLIPPDEPTDEDIAAREASEREQDERRADEAWNWRDEL